MTTQTLSQAIQLRDQLPLEQLIRLAPQLSAVYPAIEPARAPSSRAGTISVPVEAQDFWVTFAFGCVQAVILFGLVYAYFAV